MMETVSLSNRLQTVADMVTGRRVADIGCDHGFVSIYLVQAGKADHVLAADVRPGPLSRAQQHIKEVQLTPYIETRLSDGLAGVTPEDRVDTVILAGMGGRLMRRILGELDRLPVQELVLQPQSEWEELRAFLYEQAYLIVEENMVLEEGKYYPVLRAVRKETAAKDQIAFIEACENLPAEKRQVMHAFGPYLMQEKNEQLVSYIQKEQQKFTKILKMIEQHQSSSDEAVSRKKMLDLAATMLDLA